MRSRKNSANLLIAAFVVVLLSAIMAINIVAAPYADYTIVPDNKTTIIATDFDTENYGKAPASGNKDIRPDEEVNTEVGSSEFGGNIGWIAKGDWVQYTVKVANDGKYRVSAWIASDSDPTGGVKLYYNDTEVGTSENCTKDGWQVYDLYFVADVDMTAGEAVLKTEFTGGINICALEIIPLNASGNPIWLPVEHKITSFGKNIIKAIDFDPGVYGKAPADGTKELRPDEEVNTEVGGSEFGGNIGYIAAGDWVQYTVNVTKDGKYKFDAYLASDSDPTGGAKIYCDDTEIGTTPNSAKNGWQAYDVYSAGEANVTAGEHVIKVEFTGGVNFAALEVTRTGDIEVPAEETAAPEETANTDETPADTTAADGSADKADDKDGGNGTVIIIVVIAVVVVAAVVVAVILNSKKKKK